MNFSISHITWALYWGLPHAYTFVHPDTHIHNQLTNQSIIFFFFRETSPPQRAIKRVCRRHSQTKMLSNLQEEKLKGLSWACSSASNQESIQHYGCGRNAYDSITWELEAGRLRSSRSTSNNSVKARQSYKIPVPKMIYWLGIQN